MFKFSAALMTLICAGGVLAQDFPNHALRVVVPFPPGGAADIIGRTLAQPLSRAFSQSVIVENRPGANTAIGAEVVARARARVSLRSAPPAYSAASGWRGSYFAKRSASI